MIKKLVFVASFALVFVLVGCGANANEMPDFGSPTAGYVYLVWSKYGYKIGQAVNVPKRTRLFEVKLPFPIKVEHYAMFSDYTQAERSLHLHFHDKRLEGEWFALTDDDISFIKTFSRPMTVI